MSSSEPSSVESCIEPHASSSVLLEMDRSQEVQMPQVHLPIDPILKRLQRVKSFVLGIGSVGGNELGLRQSIVHSIVSRCAEKTDRKAILVLIENVGHTSAISNASSSYEIASWSAFGESKAASKTWHAQLGDLPRWKQEFGLIVLDLGEVTSQQMPRAGRLCDGIVVQLYNPTDSRATIQALKSLTQENLPVLGAWSVGLSYQRMAG